MNTYYKRLLWISLIGLIFAATAFGAKPTGKYYMGTFFKQSILEFKRFDGNRIRTWTYNNGEWVSSGVTSDSGLEWPKGSGKYAVFQSGMWLASGKVKEPGSATFKEEIRTAAAEYTVEFQPGQILYMDTVNNVEVPMSEYPKANCAWIAQNPEDPKYRYIKVNKNDTLAQNYLNWPADQGAPVDENGKPEILGDQMMWSVYNDANPTLHSQLFDSKPMGLEIQTSMFGFNRNDPLGDILFVKNLIINKSDNHYADMYVAMWSDPDVGDANDDLVGVDTNLVLGYCFNGGVNDKYYGITPPAVGYDFFQGPHVQSPGDTAYWSGVPRPGWKELGVTSFIKYINGDAILYDPETKEECWNVMTGLTPAGKDFINSKTGETSKFIASGDPVTGEGWLDIHDDPPGDRRFLMSSGPFEMAPGDTQEIVGSIIIASGSDNLSAITAMKYYDRFAQNAFDSNFELATPPQPEVEVTELDKGVLLTWDKNADEVQHYQYKTASADYRFEGYNVYQGESMTGPWKRIATYDVKNGITMIVDDKFDQNYGMVLQQPVQFGTDAGVENHIYITKDALRGNVALINNRKYYFAVSCYIYDNDALPKVVESALEGYLAIPRPYPALNLDYHAAYGDTIAVENLGGQANALIVPKVVNPASLTGETYEIRFDSLDATEDVYFINEDGEQDTTTTNLYWSLNVVDPTKSYGQDGYVVRSVIPKETDFFSYSTNRFYDGFSLIVRDIATQLVPKITNPFRELTQTIPAGLDSLQQTKVDARLAGDASAELTGGKSAMFNAWAAVGLMPNPPLPSDKQMMSNLEIRFKGPGEGQNITIWPVQAVTSGQWADSVMLKTAPFEVWDVENNKQLNALMVTFPKPSPTSPTGAMMPKLFFDDTLTTIPDSLGRPLIDVYKYSPGSLRFLVIAYDEYDAGRMYQPYKVTGDTTDHASLGWTFKWSDVKNYIPGSVANVEIMNPLIPDIDYWQFTTPVLEDNNDLIADRLEMINVFPNPYLGQQVEELNAQNRFVTFTHLPEKATVYIFTISGDLVRKLEHDTPGSSILRWNLLNHAEIPVTSGMYIAYVELPDGSSKTLKLAVFQPEERLDLF